MSLVKDLIVEWTPRVEEVRKVYLEKGRGAVAELVSCRYNSVGHLLKGLGFYTQENHEKIRDRNRSKEKCRNPFLDGWSEKLAYFVGFFLGDGSIGAKKSTWGYQTTVYSNDREVIDEFAKMFEVKVSVRQYKQGYKDGYYLNVADKGVFDTMVSLGFRPKKSKEGCELPQVPKEYFWHFIRGLFDSDGCVTTANRGTGLRCELCGHPSYMEKLSKYPELIGFSYRVYAGIARLGLSNQELVRGFYDKIYKDATVYILRKRRKFEEFYARKQH